MASVYRAVRPWSLNKNYYDNETTSAYEAMWIYFIINIVTPLHVSVTFCDHLQGGVLRRIYYKDIKTSVKCTLAVLI
jgi:hypothetical protein